MLYAFPNLQSTIYDLSKGFFAVEFLGESVDRVGVIGAAVIVEEHIFLGLITLGLLPAMCSQEKGNTEYGVMVVEEIYAAVAISVTSIVFNIGRQELRYPNCSLTGSPHTERVYVIVFNVGD